MRDKRLGPPSALGGAPGPAAVHEGELLPCAAPAGPPPCASALPPEVEDCLAALWGIRETLRPLALDPEEFPAHMEQMYYAMGLLLTSLTSRLVGHLDPPMARCPWQH